MGGVDDPDFDGNAWSVGFWVGFRKYEVGAKMGNELRIDDLRGNVWEWCFGGGFGEGTGTASGRARRLHAGLRSPGEVSDNYRGSDFARRRGGAGRRERKKGVSFGGIKFLSIAGVI